MTTDTAPPPAPPPPPPAPAKPKRRHPILRWMGRILLVVLVLLIIVFIAVSIVLQTSFPKSIVVSQVEKGLGLRMGVTSLSTGWLGHTRMSGVKLALPLSEQSFFDVKEMKVDHTNLVALALGWDIQIKRVELNGAVVYVRQNAAGQWNLQQVAELLARAGGKKTGEQTAQTTPTTPALPWLKITNLLADVKDNRGHELKIQPINVDGQPDTPVSWKYDVEIPSNQANVPPHLSFLGRVAPGGTWGQEAHIWVHDIAAWVQPWKPGFNEPVTFDGSWTGELQTNGIRGFLQISQAQYADYHLSGALSAYRADSTITISPSNLLLKTGTGDTSNELRVPSGQVSYDGKTYTLRQVQLALLGGPATINGWYQPDIHQAAIEALWQNMSVPKSGITQSGKLNFTFSNPPAANLNLKLTVSDSGTAPQGPFEAVATISATGQKLTDLDWTVTTPQLAWHRAQPVILDGLHASGTYRQEAQHQLVRMDHVALPADNRLMGTAFYDLHTKEGEVHLNGQDWPIHLLPGTMLAFNLDATGKGVPSKRDPATLVPYLDLTQFVLRSGDAELTLKGHYDGRQPKPVSAEIAFTNNPARPGAVAQVEQPSIIHGFLTGNAKMSGTLTPRQIEITGFLDGRDASILGHAVGDMRTAVNGAIDPEKGYLRANGIPFLNGVWNLSATYVQEQNGKWIDQSELALSVDKLPLQKVTQFLHAQQVDGTFQGSWTLDYPSLKPDPQRMTLNGGATITHFADSSVKADEVTFKTSLRDGLFTVDPVQVRVGNYGRIDAKAQLLLSQWRQIQASVSFTAFPISVSSATVQLWGGTDQMQVMLPDAKAKDVAARKLRVDANLNMRAGIAINEQPEGEVRVLAAMHGRVVDLRQISGNLLGGTINGDGVTDLDRVMQSRASIYWDKIDSDRFVRLYPQLKGFGGTFSGNARLQPATVPRPLEPLMLDIYLHSSKAHWRTVQVGDGQMHAYVGSYRFIAADKRPTSIQIGGGDLTFWFSASSHVDFAPTPTGREMETGVTVSNLLNVTLHRIHIDQFVQALDPDHKPGLGLLDGTVYTLSAPKTRQLAAIASEATYVPPPTTTQPTTAPATPTQMDMLQRILRTTTVDGSLAITDSDLGNFGPISFLYNAMHLGGDVRAPTGHGSISLHMEQGTLHIPNLYYFNRGIEVRGVATATEMWNVPDNPIQGSAIGTARPLKNIKLPLFAEADAIISGLQGQLTTVEFKGTVKDPIKGYIRQLGLTQMGGELRQLLLGEVGANRGQ